MSKSGSNREGVKPLDLVEDTWQDPNENLTDSPGIDWPADIVYCPFKR